MDDDPEELESRARETALRLLSRREHAGRELYYKLVQRKFPEQIIDKVLKEFQGRDWLSDERFAEVFVRSRSGQGHGELRITADLRQRGVADDIIEQALASAEVDWQALATDVARRKFGGMPVKNRNDLAKRYRFMGSRGFTAEQVRKAVEQSQHENDTGDFE